MILHTVYPSLDVTGVARQVLYIACGRQERLRRSTARECFVTATGRHVIRLLRDLLFGGCNDLDVVAAAFGKGKCSMPHGSRQLGKDKHLGVAEERL